MTTPLQKAARELILRWDSPYWKDQPGTAHFIGELRKALDAEPNQTLDPMPTTRPLTLAEKTELRLAGVSGEFVRVLAFNDRPAPPPPAANIDQLALAAAGEIMTQFSKDGASLYGLNTMQLKARVQCIVQRAIEAQQVAVPATREQLCAMADRCTPNTETGSLNYLRYARAIEAHHKIGAKK